VVNATLLGLISYGLAAVSISAAAGRDGPASDWPAWMQFLSALLIFEFLNYSLHRVMHEGRGRLGRFLWLVHAAHHLPPRLYVVMHAVAHPLNQLMVQAFVVILPLWAMGYDPLVVTSFLMVNNLHGIISHFNVDIRIGGLNYLLVGPELHRYHHAADPALAKNYGAVTPLFDLIFGSFVYRPGTPPDALGVADPHDYPDYAGYLQVLLLPFRDHRRRPAPTLEADARPI
jgi:sterol desaturase/sphingolipid hydroxylase (fatty acid hydroxylase superfamily)